MCNLYDLKDITLEAFERRKAELKEDGKAEHWFSTLQDNIFS